MEKSSRKMEEHIVLFVPDEPGLPVAGPVPGLQLPPKQLPEVPEGSGEAGSAEVGSVFN